MAYGEGYSKTLSGGSSRDKYCRLEKKCFKEHSPVSCDTARKQDQLLTTAPNAVALVPAPRRPASPHVSWVTVLLYTLFVFKVQIAAAVSINVPWG